MLVFDPCSCTSLNPIAFSSVSCTCASPPHGGHPPSSCTCASPPVRHAVMPWHITAIMLSYLCGSACQLVRSTLPAQLHTACLLSCTLPVRGTLPASSSAAHCQLSTLPCHLWHVVCLQTCILPYTFLGYSFGSSLSFQLLIAHMRRLAKADRTMADHTTSLPTPGLGASALPLPPGSPSPPWLSLPPLALPSPCSPFPLGAPVTPSSSCPPLPPLAPPPIGSPSPLGPSLPWL